MSSSKTKKFWGFFNMDTWMQYGDEYYYITFDVSDYKQEEVTIDLSDKVRIIADSDKKKTYFRTYEIPQNCDPDKVTTFFHDGLLEVRVPKECHWNQKFVKHD